MDGTGRTWPHVLPVFLFGPKRISCRDQTIQDRVNGFAGGWVLSSRGIHVGG